MSFRNRLFLFLICVFIPIFGIWIFQKKVLILDGQTMGTTYYIKAYVPKWVSQQSIKTLVSNELDLISSIFSTWDSTSELSIVNADKSEGPIELSDPLYYVLMQAFELYKDSSGYFDPTIKPLLDLWGFSSYQSYFRIPTALQRNKVKAYTGFHHINLSNHQMVKKDSRVLLDLSAIAKGYGVDQLSTILRRKGSNNFMIEIGGEIFVSSPNSSKFWTLGIQMPEYQLTHHSLFATVKVSNGAIATSGDYQNYFEKDGVVYSHIMDPVKQAPVHNNVASVTVYAPTCMLADGLATTLLTLGVNRGLSLIESYPNVECLFIVRDSEGGFTTYASSGLDRIQYQPITVN